MKAICGSDRTLSHVRSTTLLWSEQVLVRVAQEEAAGWLMINDVGARQGIVPQKNVVSAAKTRSDYLRRREEAAATEESRRKASPLRTEEHVLDQNPSNIHHPQADVKTVRASQTGTVCG